MISSARTQKSLNIASALKAAGDSMRLEILKIMRRDSFGVLELCQIFNVQQPSMSHHLKVMSNAGLLESRREGNSIYYKRAQGCSPEEQAVLDRIFELSDATDISGAHKSGVNRVQETRKQRAENFFRENADRFHEQQDLIAGFTDYGDALLSLLVRGEVRTWVEIGPGAGELLKEACHSYGRTIALDISSEMLESSRTCLGEEAHQVDFVLGDTSDALKRGIQADTVSCSMVLHHVASPAEMIRDMARILNCHGQLLICDLDKHDQEWARESCGDLWLGFAPEEIGGWCADAGLHEGREQYLALRNGFRVQIREFIKNEPAIDQ
jgi:ArsR family transcriptional regulator